MELEKLFAERLTQLRQEKGASARDMSLSLGQSEGYINGIESKKYLPSMMCFFYICEYLGITPEEFFSFDTQSPNLLSELMTLCTKLNRMQLEHVTAIVRDIVES